VLNLLTGCTRSIAGRGERLVAPERPLTHFRPGSL